MPKWTVLPWLCLTPLGWLVGGSGAALVATERPPNIVFFLIDDMGWPDLGCYGHRYHQTPTIDRLAASGARFTDFYAATPVCSSTRSTIQTGQYSARTGITDFIAGHWRPFEATVVPALELHLQPGIRTPGHLLAAQGYATGYFGKWHLGRTPAHQPDRWGYASTRLVGSADQQGRRRGSVDPKRMDQVTDSALAFIEKHRDRPFFVTLAHHAVHIPLEATQKSLAAFAGRKRPRDGVNNVRYAAMIADLDASVARVLESLKTWQLEKETIVVFTSDNGGLRLTYTGRGEVVSTNYPLRDEKGSLYEGGIRVPLIVRWPGVIAAGSEISTPGTTADLLPTFCAWASAPLPQQTLDGTSLVPLFDAPTAELAGRSIFFHYPHYHHSRPASAIRRGDWKLIEFLSDGRHELYNLAGDVGEQVNLAAHEPRRAAALHAELAAWRDAVGARMPTPNPKFEPARRHLFVRRGTGKILNATPAQEGRKQP